ncbi:CDP-diacylglycerol diphosphatase [Pararobbsia silviterrae]|uniref:CDP-diacylglycerol pyrophosphatase n=1 Tax=Pararobbsia silviterrae TaxID=1792498 RepID=A0A494YAD2_9BURK|nr:CDP-diacylglycerol diphosphatase [Pararobbsia silviterrae]RKP58700.1 CDP-diacylglycerol diphosphatase [Pararobbsia silviterrae]
MILNRLKRTACAAGALCLTGLVALAAHAANPDALWQIVSQKCVPAAETGAGQNACAYVDMRGGYALLKDINGVAQYLLIPTRRVSGIESPALLDADAPNYWPDAWHARSYVEQKLDVPLRRDEVGLAINSASGRTQNQLHIHIDCMRPDVADALAAQRGTLDAAWRTLPVALEGHRYRARVIDEATLERDDPFKALAADIASRGEAMGDQTLLVTGTTLADGQPGFIVLNDRVDGLDRASSEELLDHDCTIARRH